MAAGAPGAGLQSRSPVPAASPPPPPKPPPPMPPPVLLPRPTRVTLGSFPAPASWRWEGRLTGFGAATFPSETRRLVPGLWCCWGCCFFIYLVERKSESSFVVNLFRRWQSHSLSLAGLLLLILAAMQRESKDIFAIVNVP